MEPRQCIVYVSSHLSDLIHLRQKKGICCFIYDIIQWISHCENPYARSLAYGLTYREPIPEVHLVNRLIYLSPTCLNSKTRPGKTLCKGKCRTRPELSGGKVPFFHRNSSEEEKLVSKGISLMKQTPLRFSINCCISHWTPDRLRARGPLIVANVVEITLTKHSWWEVLITHHYTPQINPNYAFSIQIWAIGIVSNYM